MVIGRLGYGGAESQLIRLALGIAKREHHVDLLCYDGGSPRDEELASPDINLTFGCGGSRSRKLNKYRSWFKSHKPHVVHAFMKRASILAILGRQQKSQFPIVASDLSTATYNRLSPALWLALVAFAKADKVATQTKLNQRSLHLLAPWLRRKTIVIRNGLDTDQFTPPMETLPKRPFRFAVVGSVYHIKNPVSVVKAVKHLVDTGRRDFIVDWYGRKGLNGDARPSSDYHHASSLVHQFRLQKFFVFHGETNPILPAYQRSHCLLHASVQEGFPNAVVEGMACGLPLAVSRVSDLPIVVKQANNGFLFRERNPVSIANAMRQMMDLTDSEFAEMGMRSRQLAIKWFGLERFVLEYEDLYYRLTSNR